MGFSCCHCFLNTAFQLPWPPFNSRNMPPSLLVLGFCRRCSFIWNMCCACVCIHTHAHTYAHTHTWPHTFLWLTPCSQAVLRELWNRLPLSLGLCPWPSYFSSSSSSIVLLSVAGRLKWVNVCKALR